MQILSAVMMSMGLTLTLTLLPMHAVWWHVVRWAFYFPILLIGATYGSFPGLSAGVIASLSCAVVAVSRGMDGLSWSSFLAPDFAAVGFLGGYLRPRPRFPKLYSAAQADPWPALSRIYEPEITFDPNPFTSIEAAARMLGENDTSPDMRQELVGIVLKECNHLSVSITGLIQQCREAAQPRICDADVTAIAEAAGREAEFVLSGRGIIVRKEIAPDVPPIPCNPGQIRTLCVSLIITAAQSASTGTAVVLGAHCGSNGVVLEIRSRGPFVRRVVDRFVGSRRVASGIGLGACQDIVRRHNGKIAAQSDFGKGLAFTVWLPVHRNDTDGCRQGVSGRG